MQQNQLQAETEDTLMVTFRISDNIFMQNHQRGLTLQQSALKFPLEVTFSCLRFCAARAGSDWCYRNGPDRTGTAIWQNR